MTRKLIIALLLGILMITSNSCLSKKIALTEVEPLGEEKKEEPKAEPTPEENSIPPVTGMITEVEVVNGEQKYIYIKVGFRNKGIKRGLKGYIYNDVAMSERVGTFVLQEVYNTTSRAKIVELFYKVEARAIGVIEIDPKKLIK